MEREAAKALLLELLRDDPEVQGAILALIATAVGAPAPTERRKPDWVLKQLEEAGKS